VAPHIAAEVPVGFAAQTAGAVAVTAIAVTGSTTEAAAKVIAAETNSSATGAITAVAGKCAGGMTGASEHNENCKNNCGVAQHWRPLRNPCIRLDSRDCCRWVARAELAVDV
jgi:hypothetical protein